MMKKGDNMEGFLIVLLASILGTCCACSKEDTNSGMEVICLTYRKDIQFIDMSDKNMILMWHY